MKYLSLFTGIGGFELGIQYAHENHLSKQSPRDSSVRDSDDDSDELERESIPVCVGYSEIDRYATSIYQSHFPDHHNYGDITKLDPTTLPDFDFLVGGFPCQAFSIAGKRKGFDDTRGTLFFDIARILRAKQPRRFLLENVKGLLSHDNGKTFKTIIATLDELGYDLQWQVCNSKNHGVPQNRERVFIVGHLRGTPRPKVFPFTHAGGEDTRIVGQDVAYTIDANYHKGTNTLEKSRRSLVQVNDPIHSNQGTHVTFPEGKSHALSTAHVPMTIKIPEATKKGYAEARPGLAINLAVPNSKTRRGRVSDIAQTLDTGMQQHTLTPDMRIRRLTPMECERLQGFPDGWTEGVSDTQRYKTLGNAVTVNVIRDIVSALLP